MSKKSNKTIAGYHILMILSTVDNSFDPRADNIIREYLSEEAPFPINLDNELDELILIEDEDVKNHFVKKVDDFYDDSTHEERKEFLNFTKKLIRADEEITPEENSFYRILVREFKNKDTQQQ